MSQTERLVGGIRNALLFFALGCSSESAKAHVPPGVLETIIVGFGGLIAAAFVVAVFLLTWRPPVIVRKWQFFAEYCIASAIAGFFLFYLPTPLQVDFPFVLPLIGIPVPLAIFIYRCRRVIRQKPHA